MNCKNCGNKLAEGSKYCSVCGSKVTKALEEKANTTSSSKGQAIASLVIGIVSIFFGSLFMALPILGLILGVTYKEKCSEKTAGIILNIIGLVFSILSLIATLFFSFFITSGVFENIIDKIDFNEIHFNIEDNWDEYSNYVDYNNLDLTENIEGIWRELSDSNGYLMFSEDEYYFYKDMDDKEEEYITGKYRVLSQEEMFGRYEAVSRIFSKIISKIETIDVKIIEIESKETYKNGIKVSDEQLDEEDSKIFAYICNHDGVVELVLDEFEDEELHFYKVKE